MNNEITICLTSCSRFDLLEQTVKSLIANWDGPKPKEFLIYEDSDLEDPNLLVNLNWLESLVPIDFCPSKVFLGITGKVGQIKAIDALYSEVKTPYIFHCEDDWLFDRPGFIQPSIEILESDPKIVTVWLRYPNERNRHPVQGMNKTPNGTRYQKFQVGYRRVWHGFTFSPGLRRLEDYKLIAPFSSYHLGNSLDTEAAIGRVYLEKGFRAATLLQGYCRHLGDKRGLPK